MTTWSPQQERALAAVGRWISAGYNSSSPSFYLGGYAGTGKTTLATHLAGDLDGPVEFCAFTGKAALVMRQKGCRRARTIHNLIYRCTGDGSSGGAELVALSAQYEAKLAEWRAAHAASKKPGVDFAALNSPLRREVDALEKQVAEARAKTGRQPGFALAAESDARLARLIVIDECSMVDERIGRDLLSFGRQVLVLGDPAQLPPVMGGGYFTRGEPDLLLTEVHRHARDSGILRLATRVREGWRPTKDDAAHDVVVADRRESPVVRELATTADQVLVGRNKTRHAWNNRLREILGRKEALPVTGDRLVCLRNEHEAGLLNGSLWECLSRAGDLPEGTCEIKMKSLDEARDPVDVVAHGLHFVGRGDDLRPHERRDASELAYGYALTVHKSQGSQWPRVCVYDESSSFGHDAKRHLYTAVTRAAENLAVVL